MTRSIRAVTALVAVAVLVSACGSSGTPAPVATAAAAAAAVGNAAINIQGFAFPANVDVAKGTKVTWTNKDGTGHTVSSGTPPTTDGKFDGQVAGGSSFSFTFNDAGTFKYFCSNHNTMTGTITVK